MKKFIFIGLFLMQCPSFAQECNDGDIKIVRAHSERYGSSVILVECRSNVFNLLLGQRVGDFLESHRYDPTFVSRIAVLNDCEFEDCLRIARSYEMYSLSADPNNAAEVQYLNYFADKYKAWFAGNFNDITRNATIPLNDSDVKCNAIPPEGSRSCWAFECEGIRGQIALQPSNLKVRGEYTSGWGTGQMQGSLRFFIHYQWPVILDGQYPSWISIPTGTVYNRDGNCAGPFDRIINS